MPVYEYACTECGEELEMRQSFTDDALTECPACAGRLRKVLSAVGVVFKGSGFYRNDSRVAPSEGSDKGPDKGSEKGPENGSTSESSSESTSTSGSGDGTATESKPASPAKKPEGSGTKPAAGSGDAPATKTSKPAKPTKASS